MMLDFMYHLDHGVPRYLAEHYLGCVCESVSRRDQHLNQQTEQRRSPRPEWVGVIQSIGGLSKTKGRERTFLFELGHPSYSALRLGCSFSWAEWGLLHWFVWFPGLWAWVGPPASRWQVVVLSFHNLRRKHFRINLFFYLYISPIASVSLQTSTNFCGSQSRTRGTLVQTLINPSSSCCESYFTVSEINMHLFTKRLTGEEDLIPHNQVIKDFIFEPPNSMVIH